jgi:hypothetical protein
MVQLYIHSSISLHGTVLSPVHTFPNLYIHNQQLCSEQMQKFRCLLLSVIFEVGFFPLFYTYTNMYIARAQMNVPDRAVGIAEGLEFESL